MKRYDIDVHFDAHITMHGIVAASLDEAKAIARRDAGEMNLFAAAMEVTDTDEVEADSQELTTEEIRDEEREKIQEYVGWWMVQQTPTLIYSIAFLGDRVAWDEYLEETDPAWETELMEGLQKQTHPLTELADRYARMFALMEWHDVVERQLRDWDEAWQVADTFPKTKRVIVETVEYDPDTEDMIYYMVDGCDEGGGYQEYQGQWSVTCSEVKDYGQRSCRSANPANLRRWAELMINHGRVCDIYVTEY